MQKLPSERIKRGLAEAAQRGRTPGRPVTVAEEQIRAAIPLGTKAGAAALGISISTFIRRRKRIEALEAGEQDAG